MDDNSVLCTVHLDELTTMNPRFAQKADTVSPNNESATPSAKGDSWIKMAFDALLSIVIPSSSKAFQDQRVGVNKEFLFLHSPMHPCLARIYQ
jgi:hypothetical protein